MGYDPYLLGLLALSVGIAAIGFRIMNPPQHWASAAFVIAGFFGVLAAARFLEISSLQIAPSETQPWLFLMFVAVLLFSFRKSTWMRSARDFVRSLRLQSPVVLDQTLKRNAARPENRSGIIRRLPLRHLPEITLAWPAEKREILRQIYRILHDEMLPNYDGWCDRVVGPWRNIVLSDGASGYAKHVKAFLKEPSGVENLRVLLEKNAIYFDLVDAFHGAPEENHKVHRAKDEFMERLSHLPQYPDPNNLKLVDDEAFKSAVGAYGQWIRARIRDAEEMSRQAG